MISVIEGVMEQEIGNVHDIHPLKMHTHGSTLSDQSKIMAMLSQ